MRNLSDILWLTVFILSGSMGVVATLNAETYKFEAGVRYDRGEYSKAVSICTSLGRSGGVQCQFLLGQAYQHGRGVKQDYYRAFFWYEKAAKGAFPAAQINLGMMYANGWGVREKSNTEAYRWFALASTVGEQRAIKLRNEIAGYITTQSRTTIDLWVSLNTELNRLNLSYVREAQNNNYRLHQEIARAENQNQSKTNQVTKNSQSPELAKYFTASTDDAICDGVKYGNSNYIKEAQRRGLGCITRDVNPPKLNSPTVAAVTRIKPTAPIVTSWNARLEASRNSNIRSDPTASSQRLDTLVAGTGVTVTGKTTVDDKLWYRITTPQHDEAFVLGSLLTEPKPKIVSLPPPTQQRTAPIIQGKRTALVIGNSRYTELRRLRNPRDDATAVSEKLTSIGFDVIKLIDADKSQIERALRDFGDRSQSATVSIVYYAGHGLQVDGKNYLLPVDARIRKRRDLNYEVIELSTVMAELQSDKRANIIILDSCRDNPLTAQYASNYRSIGATRGLAVPISSTIGTLIAFATAPNKVAADGSGKHSPYTSAFLKWIDKPNLEIGEVFRRIREDVVKSTGGQQVPWENSSLIGGGIYLAATGAN